MGALAPAALAMAAIGAVVQGDAERDAQYASAAADEENARLSVLSGEKDAFAVRREERSAAGSALAAQGGNGIQLSGSIATLMEQSSRQAEMDVLAVRQKAYGEAENYQQRATNSRKAGDNAMVGALFSAVSGAVAGASRMRADNQLRAQAGRERTANLGGSSLSPFGGG